MVVELIFERIRKEWQLSPIKPEQAASRFEAVGQLWKHVVVKDKVVLKHSICSEANAKLLLGTREALTLLWPITLVVNSPILIEGPDGKADILAAGYHHWGSGTLVTKGERPPDPGLDEATESLLEVLEDFDFELPADRLRALAAMITPAIVWGGFLGDAHVPLFLAEANDSQAGKGYILERAAAIYGETLLPQAPRKGGVGSFDEDFNAILLKGKPIIFFDNLRDPLDSPYVESFLTARGSFLVRTPHRAAVEIDVRKYIIFATSNGLETTRDLENRLIRMRIRKRPPKYKFKSFSGLRAFDHIKKNQSYYLGCVFAIVRHWLENGKKRTRETRHSFREWAQILDWILMTAFKGKVRGRLMDECHPPSKSKGLASQYGLDGSNSSDSEPENS